MYTNADQLTTTKKKQLEQEVVNEKPHFIVICEVKRKYGERWQLHEYQFSDYEVVNHTNMENNCGRGIVILSHSSIKHLIVDIKCPVTFDEACIVEVRLLGKDILALA